MSIKISVRCTARVLVQVNNPMYALAVTDIFNLEKTGPAKSTLDTAKVSDISTLKVGRDLVVSREADIGFSR